MTEAAQAPANWAAMLRMSLRREANRTRLVPLERYGPLTVQRPFYPERECCHVYLIHPPGGVVGGDRLDLRVDLHGEAQGLFTMPGAAKFYLSSGDTACIDHRFRLEQGAELEFLPQENIYFPGAIVDAKTTIELEPGARVLLWEKHCFGRPANRESFSHGTLRSRIDLRSNGKLIFTETQRIDADEIGRGSGIRGMPVCGSLLVFGDGLDNELAEQLQQAKPARGVAGLTRPRDDLLLARYIGPDTGDLDRYFVGLWERLRPALLRRDACHPRIWNT